MTLKLQIGERLSPANLSDVKPGPDWIRRVMRFSRPDTDLAIFVTLYAPWPLSVCVSLADGERRINFSEVEARVAELLEFDYTANDWRPKR